MSIADELAAWLSDETGQRVEIGGVRRTSNGFSRENWVFDASWDGRDHALIARRDPVGSVLDTDRRIETAVLRALADTDVPSPTLRWADVDGLRLGRPALIMDLAPGTCEPLGLNGVRPLEDRVALAQRIYARLADIHLLDWVALGLGDHLVDPGPNAARAAIAHWEGELRRVQLDPEPELAFVFAWLRANAPENVRTTLVHGDFKPGNLLLGEGADGTGTIDVSAVLDWETVHLGDPHEDLGWVTNPLRAGEHRIAGHWAPDDLLRHWSDRTGWTPDPDVVRWWQVLANVKLSIIVLSGTHAFVDHRLDRVHQSPVMLYRILLDQIGA